MGLIYNNKEIWNSSGEVLYQIPTGYDGFFLTGSTGVPDIKKFKAISGSNTILLSKSIADCDNGIVVFLSNQVATCLTAGDHYKTTYEPFPPVSPQKMLIKKGSPKASMTFGWYGGTGASSSLTSTGNISVSENQMKVTTDSEAGMYLYVDNEYIFWVITSIVSY
ncbi:hypothetical protein [Levilactobacillus brevis]|uniref:hypothetical protein n=1 Tax=Levilactobacillus brevis TaxID=1580 RepID=UPI000B3E4DD8|nr:hypothetical protein [Levilactobacillus brevis]ARW21890.1 hypothetical protein S101174_01051 [Levilactobacillus brevis]